MPESSAESAWFVRHRADETINRVPHLLHFGAILLISAALLWWLIGASSARHMGSPAVVLVGLGMIRLGLRLERKIIYYPCFWLDTDGIHYSNPTWTGRASQVTEFIPWSELRSVKYVAVEGFAGLDLIQGNHRGNVKRMAQLSYGDAQQVIPLLREQIAKHPSRPT